MKLGIQVRCTTRISLFAVASLLAWAAPASAALVISNAPTSNVSCAGGVCTATAGSAVLNASALQSLLASGDTAVATGTATNDIKITAPVTWASASRLTLDARRSLHINKPVLVTGIGALTLTTNDGGSGGDFIFSGSGHVEFSNLSSSLIINGLSYMLLGNVASLASAVAANPGGAFALAQPYDALADGFYPMSPVQTFFSGKFEGLGNTISRLRVDINVSGVSVNAGLFDTLDNGSLVRDLHLTHALVKLHITGHGPNVSSAGVLAGNVAGQIAYVTTSGNVQTHIVYPIFTGGLVGHLGNALVRDSSANVTVDGFSTTHVSYAGGLVGWAEQSSVLRSAATGTVTSNVNVQSAYAAGLIGRADGTNVSQSWATGAATATSPIEAMTGGLIGQELGGAVADCYAMGNSVATVTSHNAFAGGLIGETVSGPVTTATSYSTGSAMSSGGAFNFHGGFIGYSNGTASDDYWDIDTSGDTNATGSGTSAGITGLSDAALLSGLPSGFSASVWAQNAAINGGYPYLTSNMP